MNSVRVEVMSMYTETVFIDVIKLALHRNFDSYMMVEQNTCIPFRERDSFEKVNIYFAIETPHKKNN